MLYNVTIKETLEKTVPVEAEDMISAYNKAKELYKQAKVVLTADDMVDYSIGVNKDADKDS